MTENPIHKTKPDYFTFTVIGIGLFSIAKTLSYENGTLAYSKIPIIVIIYLSLIVIIGRNYIKTLCFFEDKILVKSLFYLNDTVFQYCDIEYVMFRTHVPNSGARVEIHFNPTKSGISELRYRYSRDVDSLLEFLKNKKNIKVHEN